MSFSDTVLYLFIWLLVSFCLQFSLQLVYLIQNYKNNIFKMGITVQRRKMFRNWNLGERDGVLPLAQVALHYRSISTNMHESYKKIEIFFHWNWKQLRLIIAGFLKAEENIQWSDKPVKKWKLFLRWFLENRVKNNRHGQMMANTGRDTTEFWRNLIARDVWFSLHPLFSLNVLWSHCIEL